MKISVVFHNQYRLTGVFLSRETSENQERFKGKFLLAYN